MKCDKHPRYHGKGAPRSACKECWRKYARIHWLRIRVSTPPGGAYPSGVILGPEHDTFTMSLGGVPVIVVEVI